MRQQIPNFKVGCYIEILKFNAISTETECGETKSNFESTEPKILFQSNSEIFSLEDERLDEKVSTRQTMNMLENNEIFFMRCHYTI